MRKIFLFLFEVHFPPYANPKGTTWRFITRLQAFLKARRLRCLIGGHGGEACAYGVVYRKRWGVTAEHRLMVADLIKVQRIRATVKLGELEEDNHSTNLVRKVTEWIFEVDNLTKEDRRAAAAQKRAAAAWKRKFDRGVLPWQKSGRRT